jgi:hypothetical protein
MPPITVRLSDEAAEGIRESANELGVSITALVEAWGQALTMYPLNTPLPATQLGVIARRVDFERRQRGNVDIDRDTM